MKSMFRPFYAVRAYEVAKMLDGLTVEEARSILSDTKGIVTSASLVSLVDCKSEAFLSSEREALADKEGLAAFKEQILGEVASIKLCESPKGMLFDVMSKLATAQKITDPEPANTDAPVVEDRMTETSIALVPLFKQIGEICEANGLEFLGVLGGPMPSPLSTSYHGEGKYLVHPCDLIKLAGTLLVDAPIADAQYNKKCIIPSKLGTQEYRDRENHKNSVSVELCNLVSERGLSVHEGCEALQNAIYHLDLAPAAPLERLDDFYTPL